MKRVAIIAAMPGELKFLVRGWRHTRSNGVELWQSGFLDENGEGGQWIAACAGAGVDAATRAFAEAEKDGAVSSVISTGWAGALSEEFAPGRAYQVSGVLDARTGERFAASSHPSRKNNDAARLGHPDEGAEVLKGHGFSRATEAPKQAAALATEGIQADKKTLPQGLKPSDCTSSASSTAEAVPFQNALLLVTGSRVADAAEKQRLAATYQADLVDMEAAGLARLAAMRGIPFYCVKGVSDGYSDKLPDFNRFISSDGQFRLLRFVVFALFRPWRWPALMRMGENSTRAAQAMAASLLDLLNQRFAG
jgi:nucleoside phosphorylase